MVARVRRGLIEILQVQSLTRPSSSPAALARRPQGFTDKEESE